MFSFFFLQTGTFSPTGRKGSWDSRSKWKWFIWESGSGRFLKSLPSFIKWVKHYNRRRSCATRLSRQAVTHPLSYLNIAQEAPGMEFLLVSCIWGWAVNIISTPVRNPSPILLLVTPTKTHWFTMLDFDAINTLICRCFPSCEKRLVWHLPRKHLPHSRRVFQLLVNAITYTYNILPGTDQ